MGAPEQECGHSDGALVSARAFDFFHDDAKAHHFIDMFRSEVGRVCPRCGSKLIKKVNTRVYRELHRCVGCGHMFNALSGTVFKGSKIPLTKYFQIISIYNALGDDVSLRDVSYILGVSYKTSASLLSRMHDLKIDTVFAFTRKNASERMKLNLYNANASDDIFFSYCEMKNIVIDPEKLYTYFRTLVLQEIKAVDPDIVQRIKA